MSVEWLEAVPADEAAPTPAAHWWFLVNRVAAYCLLNLLDDPAWLALAFC